MKIRLWDKVHALEMTMKHFALQIEKVALTVRTDQITTRLLVGRGAPRNWAERFNDE